jgi:hypothetical protein
MLKTQARKPQQRIIPTLLKTRNIEIDQTEKTEIHRKEI